MARNKYRPSGKTPVPGILLLWIPGWIGEILLMFAYLYVSNLMPNLGLRLIVLLLAVFLMSMWMRLMVRFGRLRAPGRVFWMVVIIGLISIYLYRILQVVMIAAAWEYGREAYLSHFASLETLERGWYLLRHPCGLFSSLGTVVSDGFVKIRGTTLKGGLLVLWWIIEGLVLVFVPAFQAMSRSYKIYSEVRHGWLNHTIAFNIPYVKENRLLRRQLIKGDQDAFDSLHYYKVQGMEAHGIVTFYRRGSYISPYVSMQMIKAVQVGPKRVRQFYIPILEQWDIGEDHKQELLDRLLEESGQTLKSVTKHGNYREKISWKRRRDHLSHAMVEQVEAVKNRVEVEESGSYAGTSVRGFDSETLYAPVITPEMEEEYKRRAMEEQKKVWAENEEQLKQEKHKKKSKRRSTRIK